MKAKKIIRPVCIILTVVLSVLFCLSTFGTVAYAAGLVDDTQNPANLYSKYPIANYQLDFYVDNSWAWLPWNWGDGIGKSVMYGLYCITNFIWTISLYLSNATGYVVQQAYKLDFINDTADKIGKNIQTLAGVTSQGFSNEGFYVGFLLILILALGIYVAYTGLIKRETSKAIHAVTNFVVVFLLSAAFIAFAPSYIKNINAFSSDISTAALDLGTKIVVPDSESAGKNSVDLIRNNLFSIQIQQPWLLLQYGNSSKDSIGSDRVERLLSVSPKANDGKEREEVVKKEIEDRNNTNLSLPEVMNRLGMVFFLLIFNLGITVFVFLLTGIMIFSQILFIIFAMFLPISFLLSMIPTYESMAKKAIVKLFNTIMMRAGITLVITIAFSISTMFYNISDGSPFFMIAFLQIVTFAGIYFQLGELMSMFSLQASDSQNMGRRIFRKPYMFVRQNARRLERKIGRTLTAGNTGARAVNNGAAASEKTSGTAKTTQGKQNTRPVSSPGSRAGAAIGSVLDTKNHVRDKAKQVKENVQNIPTHAAYAVHTTKEAARENISDFKHGIVEEQEKRQIQRSSAQQERQKSVAEKQQKLKQTANERQDEPATKATTEKSAHSPKPPVTSDRKPSPASTKKERPVVPYKDNNKNTQLRESVTQRTPARSEREQTNAAQVPAEKTYPTFSPAPKERTPVVKKSGTSANYKPVRAPVSERTTHVTNKQNRQTATTTINRTHHSKQKKSITRKKGH